MRNRITMGLYMLKGHEVVQANDVIEWSKAMEGNRHVGNTTLPDGTHISTVFLGIDHNLGGRSPIFFETMIFNNPEFEHYQQRYATWEEAEKGHQKAIEKIFNVD